MPDANTPPAAPLLNCGPLPNPFLPPRSIPITTRDQWPAGAKAWRDLILDMEYGGFPPNPDDVRVECLCEASIRHWERNPNIWSYRVTCHGGKHPLSFSVRVLFPSSPGPFPAIINGDACWWYVTDEVIQRVLDHQCALVLFNRTELAPDIPPNTSWKRQGGLFDVYPDQTFGALSAWAWGYRRCVDLLHTLPFIDRTKIAISGHSRGAKTALIAAAMDERITLVNDNASGTGGSGAFRYVGDGGETLGILDVFPSWFGTGLHAFRGREDSIPFDQHCLLAAIAPRPLLLTYALDDRWANPEGMVQCAWAAQEVYRFLGREDAIAFHLRPGIHEHSLEDWNVLLQFIDWQWRGKARPDGLNEHPYGHLAPVFDWIAPAA
jgi:hypothetical protein